MSILIRWQMMVYREGSVEITEPQLEVIAAGGVDMTDEFDIADAYRANLGKTIDGVRFPALGELADDWDTADDKFNEITEWDAEGEAPDRFWPDDVEYDDQDVEDEEDEDDE